MTAPEHRRWPVAPLLNLPDITTRSLRQALHMSGTNWQRALTEGLTDQQADRAAIRHGWHPANVWPGWAEAALTPLDHMYLEQGWRTAWLWTEGEAA